MGEAMARRRQPAVHATLYDFRDIDIMLKIDEVANGSGIDVNELAELMGFDAEEGGRPMGGRMRWMRQYGMVVYDDKSKHWALSRSGKRIVGAKLRAPELKIVKEMPDEKMI